MLQKQQSFRRHAITWLLALFLVLAMMGIATPFFQPQKARAAASPNGTIPLLLIHGYTDDCKQAFQDTNFSTSLDTNGNNTPGPYATGALAYFTDHGWLKIDQVGYYTKDLNDANCNSYANTDANGINHCKALLGSYIAGSTDDPIQHLGCLLAWYIYDQYTFKGQPVDILAHSMGGLIVRDALGQSGSNSQYPDTHFPNQLNVQRVVTVATPHGGEGGFYSVMGWLNVNSNEVSDMAPNSSFMNLIAHIQKPQGSSGTFWGLMGASDPGVGLTLSSEACPKNKGSGYSSGSIISCFAGNYQAGVQYPDGDGIVQALSMMAMKADYKVLYGSVNNSHSIYPIYNGANTDYEHEANTCGNLFGAYMCLSAPFYLTDGTPDTQLTQAWVCSGNCTSTDFTDLHLGPQATQASVYHSLAEIAWMLAPPTHISTNQITYRQPGEAYFNGWLYTCWVGSDSHIYLGYSTDTGHFQYDTKINDTSTRGCSLAGFNNRLYLAFTGTNNTIYVEYTTDGITFQNHVAVPDTSYAPAQIALFEGRLYLAFTGTDGVVYTESYDGNTTFANHRGLPSARSNTSIGPAINAFLNRIYISWSGTDSSHSINLASSSDGINFTSPILINGATSNSGPALTNVNNYLYIGWQGMDANSHLNVKRMDSTGYLYATDTLADTTDAAPALAAFNNQIIWAWSGTDFPPYLYIAAEY